MDFDVFSELRKLVEEATSRKKRKKRTQSKEAGNSKKRKRLEEEDDESERDPRQVPKRLMSAIKKLVKQRTSNVQIIFDLLYEKLGSKFSLVRLLAFQIIVVLFERSKVFRVLMLEKFRDFMTLTMNISPRSKANLARKNLKAVFKQPLPEPRFERELLKREALVQLDKWHSKYGGMQGYRLLKLGYEYVRKSLSAQLPDSRKRGEAAKKKEEAKRKRRNAIVRARFDRLDSDFKGTVRQLENLTEQMNGCFEIILPSDIQDVLAYHSHDIHTRSTSSAGRRQINSGLDIYTHDTTHTLSRVNDKLRCNADAPNANSGRHGDGHEHEGKKSRHVCNNRALIQNEAGDGGKSAEAGVGENDLECHGFSDDDDGIDNADGDGDNEKDGTGARCDEYNNGVVTAGDTSNSHTEHENSDNEKESDVYGFDFDTHYWDMGEESDEDEDKDEEEGGDGLSDAADDSNDDDNNDDDNNDDDNNDDDRDDERAGNSNDVLNGDAACVGGHLNGFNRDLASQNSLPGSTHMLPRSSHTGYTTSASKGAEARNNISGGSSDTGRARKTSSSSSSFASFIKSNALGTRSYALTFDMTQQMSSIETAENTLLFDTLRDSCKEIRGSYRRLLVEWKETLLCVSFDTDRGEQYTAKEKGEMNDAVRRSKRGRIIHERNFSKGECGGEERGGSASEWLLRSQLERRAERYLDRVEALMSVLERMWGKCQALGIMEAGEGKLFV